MNIRVRNFLISVIVGGTFIGGGFFLKRRYDVSQRNVSYIEEIVAKLEESEEEVEVKQRDPEETVVGLDNIAEETMVDLEESDETIEIYQAV
tara:strand:- start:444 stop:719 length:276 start_codon:yes stop_codon:yes gene_type:complete